MLEIEAKIKVEDHDPARRRLTGEGATRIGNYLEFNAILDRGAGELQLAGAGLRVREMKALDGRAAPNTITYKGPVQKSEVKRREEIEIEIGDADTAVALLRAIGFEVVISYKKRRERWRLDPCTVELDEVPLLGTYVEIEGPSESAVQRVRERLELDALPHVRHGYVRMLAERCAELGRSPLNIEFEQERQ